MAELSMFWTKECVINPQDPPIQKKNNLVSILQKRLLTEENLTVLNLNPLVLSHHCMGLMYRRPKVITLDAAAMIYTPFTAVKGYT